MRVKRWGGSDVRGRVGGLEVSTSTDYTVGVHTLNAHPQRTPCTLRQHTLHELTHGPTHLAAQRDWVAPELALFVLTPQHLPCFFVQTIHPTACHTDSVS